MDTNYSESIVRNLTAKILHQKNILPEDYELIIESLQKRNDENIYLIQVLKYLNLSSDMIDLLITSYESRELFFFLQGEGEKKYSYCYNSEQKVTQSFTPMTTEEALKKNFKDTPNVKLPEGNDIGRVTEKFQFFDEKENKYFNCERAYHINSEGQVVEFLDEKITPADRLSQSLYGGILGEEFFRIN